MVSPVATAVVPANLRAPALLGFASVNALIVSLEKDLKAREAKLEDLMKKRCVIVFLTWSPRGDSDDS